MAVPGSYMVWRIKGGALKRIGAYGDCILGDVMPTFSNLDQRAEQVADAEFARLGSEPVGEDWNGDMADLAETANDKGLVFYETMTGIRQSFLNLFSVGLFHLIEQELADLCRDGAFTVDPPADNKISLVKQWYATHFDLELSVLPSWPAIEELRLLANTVKHGEGSSAKNLRAQRPELLCHPALRGIDPTPRPWPIQSPLAGEDLYVTEEIFQAYSQAANQFIGEIAKHFEERAEEYYPRE